MTDEYDFIVIGAGPVGENVAQYATEHSGLTAVLVESELLGGECSYYACMPSKALLRPIEIASDTKHLDGVTDAGVDLDGLLKRRDYWVSNYDDSGQVKWAEGAGLAVVRGSGRLTGERTVRVGDRTLSARRAVVVATGSTPVVPPEYADVAAWGSRDATGVQEVPERLVIVGGGVVACEAATWMAALGSRVTMLVRGDRLLANQESFASEVVLAALQDAGVDVRLGAEVTGCARPDARDTGLGRVHGGVVTVTLGDDTVEADEILLAVGRRPRLAELGLDELGLGTDPAKWPDWLVAVGDASGEAPLTHWGKYRARVIGERLAGGPAKEPDDVPVPQVVFTDPQVAQVGPLTSALPDAEVVRVPFNAAGGSALLRDDVTGWAQLAVDRSTRTVQAATFVGPQAGELLHAATIAIVGRVPVATLRHAVPSYPTASELWLRLLEELPREMRELAG